jgi:hypothetical protein
MLDSDEIMKIYDNLAIIKAHCRWRYILKDTLSDFSNTDLEAYTIKEKIEYYSMGLPAEFSRILSFCEKLKH